MTARSVVNGGPVAWDEVRGVWYNEVTGKAVAGIDWKRFWVSKTFWFCLLTLVIGVANLLGFAEFKMPTELADIWMVVLPVVAMILRFISKQAIK